MGLSMAGSQSKNHCLVSPTGPVRNSLTRQPPSCRGLHRLNGREAEVVGKAAAADSDPQAWPEKQSCSSPCGMSHTNPYSELRHSGFRNGIIHPPSATSMLGPGQPGPTQPGLASQGR